jgi:hypothetical protein
MFKIYGSQNFKTWWLLRELEISLLPDYKLYLLTFPFSFGELLETVMPLIQKEDVIMRTCCATPQSRPYTVNMFVQRPQLCEVSDCA